MTEERFVVDVAGLDDFDRHLLGLAEILNACVHGGAGVSFTLPHSVGDSELFWRSKVRPGVADGSRIVLMARKGERVAGTVQLDCSTPQNQPHRASVSKVLVHPDFRRQGIASALMMELERHALARGRTLLTLDTVTGSDAETMYRKLGYNLAGVIPGYSRAALEPRLEAASFMYKVLDAA